MKIKYFIVSAFLVLLFRDDSKSLSNFTGVPYFEFGNTGSFSGTTFALDSAFVPGVSGDAHCVRFQSPVNQTSGNLTVYAYLTAETGAPTSVTAYIYNGAVGAEDDDRPSTTTVLATSPAISCDVSTNAWVTFSFTGVTIVAGQTYWIVIGNTSGTPSSNFPTFMIRGMNGYVTIRTLGITTTDGFTADGSASGSEGTFVVKFNDGQIFGNPYVRSTAHASNTNDRGMRYIFTTGMTVQGIIIPAISAGPVTKIYQGTTLLGSSTPDRTVIQNGGVSWFNPPVRFAGGTAYDVILDYGSNSTTISLLDAGATPPADVTACMFAGLSYLDGTTPGSYTVSSGMASGISILVENYIGGATIYDSTFYDSTIY